MMTRPRVSSLVAGLILGATLMPAGPGTAAAPGGEVVRGRYLYFTTGDTIPPARDGTIDRLDLRTGRRTVWARGLSMPNGLAFLPGGDAVVSRDLEGSVPPTDITLVPARSRRPRVNWARVPDSNGLAVDPTGALAV